MRKQHIYETTFNYDDVLNIQYAIVKGFGSREILLSMGVKAYFGPRITKIPHGTPNYEPDIWKFEIDYYRQTYFFTEKLSHIREKL